MKHADYRRAFDELEPEFELVRQLIELRLARKLSQRQLARKAHALQPSIARLERRGQSKDLAFMRRVAHALGAEIEIRLVPRTRGMQTASSRHGKNKRVA